MAKAPPSAKRERIKAFERMGLHRKYPPIIVCCMAFIFHDRILSSGPPFAASNNRSFE